MSSLLLPYERLDVFRVYINLYEEIHLYGNSNIKCNINKINYIMLYNWIHYMYLWLLSSSLEPIDRIFHVDAIYILVNFPGLYPCINSMALMILYFHYSIYFIVNIKVVYLLKSILFEKNCQLLQGITIFNDITAQNFARNLALAIVNVLKMTFLIPICIFLIF